ncbi:MAG TPA: phage/plasmid primase, P4 family [Bacteroidales bacterium]|nr:phage/plasmid primase, P4 family [Bacteroidales bacterium]
MSSTDMPRNDLAAARQIIDSMDIFFYNQSFYSYIDHYWRPIELEIIKKKILELLDKKYRQSRVNNIVDILKLMTHKTEDEINLNFHEYALNTMNGIYYLKEGKLVPHSEDTKHMFSTNRINVTVDPEATCERWIQFVSEIFEPDHDRRDKIKLLQEFLGYCLTPMVSFQKALILLGTGSNGKSIILQVMEKILGEDNYSSIELNQLSNKNYIVELQNKLVNFCSEIDHKGSFSSGIFKRIITGETLTGDAKFKNPIKFQPYCKLLFATNDLPQTVDTTKGFFRRIFILKFNRSFEGDHCDPDLLKKLESEISGIFNWLLEGLGQLIHDQAFTVPSSSEEETYNYLEGCNSVVAFINERCTIESNTYEVYQDLYESYTEYCAQSGNKPFKKASFRNEIEKNYSPRILYTRSGEKGNHFKNVRIKNNTIYP